jgi:hypothetical protein
MSKVFPTLNPEVINAPVVRVDVPFPLPKPIIPAALLLFIVIDSANVLVPESEISIELVPELVNEDVEVNVSPVTRAKRNLAVPE